MNTVSKDGDHLLIRIHKDDAHSLCVALQECPCKMTKSHATAKIRKSLREGLARAGAR